MSLVGHRVDGELRAFSGPLWQPVVVDHLAGATDMSGLADALQRETERRRTRGSGGPMPEERPERRPSDRIVGNAPRMQEVFRTVAQVAGARASVVITGESGTGKEMIATAIHEASPRSRGPFVKLHCAALAETVLESELFGHERGAFTGAVARREGRFLQADGGTLFLDEIGDVTPGVQVKLLRFLQEHEFERVGGNDTLHVDVRVLAATNRDLKAAVAAGTFREDLYYRLNVINIGLPALRDRPGDVPLLARYFLDRYAVENGKELDGYSDEAMACLEGYPWPGNVRELRNIVERAVVMCPGRSITKAELPPQLTTVDPGQARPVGSTLRDIERHAILQALESTGGATSKAAALLGISVRKIQYRLREYRSTPAVAGEPASGADRHPAG